jgi:hypothetical protein
MKRLGSLGAVLPLLALGAAACGANTTTSNQQFKFTMLSDFEASMGFNPFELWNGGWAKDADMTPAPPGYTELWKVEASVPPRLNADGTTSQALHKADSGGHTIWGSVIYGDLQSAHKAVNLTRFKGFSLWARSAGAEGFTVKIGFSDYGSFDQVMDLPQLCDIKDTAVGGLGCYDDYAAKIYPDGVWRRYDIPFSSLATGGWGLVHPFDQSKVYRIKISMLPTTAYDLWFDDMAFYTD